MDSVNDLIHFNGFSLSLLMSGVASLLIALTIYASISIGGVTGV
jgi:hypothetical protein